MNAHSQQRGRICVHCTDSRKFEETTDANAHACGNWALPKGRGLVRPHHDFFDFTFSG